MPLPVCVTPLSEQGSANADCESANLGKRWGTLALGVLSRYRTGLDKRQKHSHSLADRWSKDGTRVAFLMGNIDNHSDVPAESTARRQIAVFGPGDTIQTRTDGKGKVGRFLLLGGDPIGEPVAWQGPFVMNTAQDITKAMYDYRNGAMGTIAR
ncbi:MAG: hypothetical protein ACI8PT_000162 [Gammaproteobacteria bacterium]|jgi:hypothetical protein